MRLLRACTPLLWLPFLLPAQDDQGLGRMWRFERPPLAYLQQEYGFAPTQEWFDRLRLSSLRLGNGCSASFVSSRGLILTNNHCVREFVTKTQGKHDWLRDGFVAAELGDEVKLEGLAVRQLVDMIEVTAGMVMATAALTDPDEIAAAQASTREKMLAASRLTDPGLEPQIVELFHGAVWQLYRYRVIDDVRLVLNPHLQIAHFGGDPDNFTYPRYAMDFALLRAYVDGKPLDTSVHHLAWRSGVEPGELVFLTGNPGATQRQLTVAQLGYQRDGRYPYLRELVDNRLAILRRFAAADEGMARTLQPLILRHENGQKLFRGEHAALNDPELMARKQAAESRLRTQVGSRPELAGYRDLWDQLASISEAKLALEPRANFHNAGGWPPLVRAVQILDAVDGNHGAAEAVRAGKVTADPVQAAFFADSLTRARRWLPKDDPVLALFAGEPQRVVESLLRDTRLLDDTHVDALLRGGKQTVDADADPMLAVARKLRPLIRSAARQWGALIAREQQQAARLGRALFDTYGHDISPDATSTLRFSDGRVKGYEYNGTVAPWRTVFLGMFARSAEFDGAPPFDLPRDWLLARDRLDLHAAVNFVCTVDSTGGNSGSPLVDRDGRLVGLLFDGNIESMANEFFYGETVERSVCVHPQGMEEAMRKVYRANRVLDELLGR